MIDKWAMLKSYLNGAYNASNADNLAEFISDTLDYMDAVDVNEQAERERYLANPTTK